MNYSINHFQALDPRILLAITATFQNNMLNVTGTDGDDSIYIYDNGVYLENRDQAVIQPILSYRLRANTKWSIYVDAKGGNDAVKIAVLYGTPAGKNIQQQRLYGSSGNDTIEGGLQKPNIFDRRLWYGDGLIDGGDGNDRLFGNEGVDSINGNKGNDLLYGGAGDDSIWGGNGNDLLLGEKGADWLEGENDDDTLVGGANRDWMSGDLGTDRLDGRFGPDDDDYINSSDQQFDRLLVDRDDFLVKDLIDRITYAT